VGILSILDLNIGFYTKLHPLDQVLRSRSLLPGKHMRKLFLNYSSFIKWLIGLDSIKFQSVPVVGFNRFPQLPPSKRMGNVEDGVGDISSGILELF